MIRNGRRRQHHNAVLLFARKTRQQQVGYLGYLQPVSTPSVQHALRDFSNKDVDSESGRTSFSASEAKKEMERSADVKDAPTIATPSKISSIGPSVGAENRQQLQHKPQEPPSSVPLKIPASDVSSSSTHQTLTPSSTTSATTNPKASSIDAPKTPSTGDLETATISPKKPNATGGVVLEEYYDRMFRLWSERSGTSEILALKESVNEAGAAFDTASAAVTTNRRNLDEALRKWERASGQHLQLLQRRESWTPEDAQRFADFVSLEITSRAELEQARHDLGRSEELLTKSQLDYINKMRRRYHEEQIWQDQWRVLGTYGTWTLIVLNSCVFLGSQFFQRRRERERTETIERLIRESRNETVIPTQGQIGDDATGEALTVSKEDTLNKNEATDTAEGVENNNNSNNKSNNNSNNSSSSNNALSSGEEPMAIHPPEIDQTTVSSEDTERSSPEPGDNSKHGEHPVAERMGRAIASVGSFVNRWEHRVRSRVRGVLGIANQKLHRALPARIAEDMPKSVEEIHVPSAIIGASVGGLAVVTISMIFSAFSNRKY